MALPQRQMELRPRKPTREEGPDPKTPVLLSASTQQSVEVQTEDFEVPVVTMEDFEVVDVNDKLNLLMSAINKINTSLHLKMESTQNELSAEVQSIKPVLQSIQKDQQETAARVDDLEKNMVKHSELLVRIDALETANTTLVDEIAVLKGLTQVQDKQIHQNKDKIIDLTARSMSNNILISGLIGDDKDEDCIDKVLKFLKSKL